MIGRTARYLTMRVKSDGRVSSDPQKNEFIRVSPSADTGDIVSITALQKVPLPKFFTETDTQCSHDQTSDETD